MKKQIEPTFENLKEHAVKPLILWLMDAAINGRDLTYGEVKRRLEAEHGFSTIFSTMVGMPAGAAMDLLHEYDQSLPLLNVLLVKKDTHEPGSGAGSYLAEKYGLAKLREEKAPDRYPHLWRKTFQKAAGEVYEYQNWKEVYEGIYKEKWPEERLKKPKGTERDGRFGKGGEGENHKALRLWVKDNIRKVAPGMKNARSETEVELYSGDRVDVAYFSSSRTLGIEVKSIDSDWFDLRRGIFQCVKYEAVLRAQDPRSNHSVKVLLITETELDGNLKSLARRLGVRHAVFRINS
ncbi:hypothetical protein UF64_10110 [Thalassospira sp. HJ]|uniref:hypothetical protein n=1 Tax=Thalassospira sp. HJ TaxID=1616823 RepID=UPI0005CED38F|nr:hypothetical protein [Thalassospira sp. HJ]KJE35045.1 hypothetical protein UF64_10110 [Thalassospira sp. HJ]